MNGYAHKLHSNFIKRFCLLVILPFFFILTFFFVQSNRVSWENDQASNEKLASQVRYNLSQNLKFAENVASTILQNEMLVDFLDKPYQSRVDLAFYSSAIYDFVKMSNGLASDLRLRIYMENQTIPLGYGTFYHIQELDGINAIRRFYDSGEEAGWLDGATLPKDSSSYHKLRAEDDYCYLRKIRLGSRSVGLILIQMPKRLLNTVQPDDGQQAPYEMSNLGRTLVYNFTTREISGEKLARLQREGAGVTRDRGHVYGRALYPGYPFDVVVATLPSVDRGLTLALALAFLLFLTLSVLLFIRYSNKIIHDLNYCLDAMNGSIDNNFQNDLHVNRKDEISYIADRINYLIFRIRKLIAQNVRQETAAKSSQLIALQHQINPHFLYNTMETFSARMELAGLYEESGAMAAFCRILRYNINSDTLTVPLREELRQVENYVKIQKLQELSLRLETDIPEELYETPIIKFILQPFVENSVKYRREDAPVYVRIAASREGHVIRLTIQDNGLGISARQLHRLNTGFVSPSLRLSRADQQIGLFNINERLRLFYGDRHHITASVSQGLTTFSVTYLDTPPVQHTGGGTGEAGETFPGRPPVSDETEPCPEGKITAD